ncbi:MAG: ABC transporter ATP-binding protein [Chloroflexi bacterium]|nr:ABC transporter ATP-binding protein [Chloroflexota bacterium]
MSILAVDSVVAGYGETEILHGISMRIEPGEAVTIFGPNGCGKSTLMKTIFGLLTPKQGSIVFEDFDITGMPTDRLIRMGMSYVPQTGNIFPSLTIEENLEMGAFVDDTDVDAQISEMYRIFPDLERSRRQRAGSLSGGQRQMLAFGRALMLRPRLLMLDEPSAGLSPIMAQLIFDRLRDIRSTGVAILIIEHNIRTALAMSDRGYVLADGQNQLEGSASGLLDNPEIGRLYLGGRIHDEHAE